MAIELAAFTGQLGLEFFQRGFAHRFDLVAVDLQIIAFDLHHGRTGGAIHFQTFHKGPQRSGIRAVDLDFHVADFQGAAAARDITTFVFTKGDGNFLGGPFAEQGKLHAVTFLFPGHQHRELRGMDQQLVVELRQDIIGLQSGLLRRAGRADIFHDQTHAFVQRQMGGQILRRAGHGHAHEGHRAGGITAAGMTELQGHWGIGALLSVQIQHFDGAAVAETGGDRYFPAGVDPGRGLDGRDRRSWRDGGRGSFLGESGQGGDEKQTQGYG